MLMEEGLVVNRGEDVIDLPPGFRFHPTDEEIITHYLTQKVVMRGNFSACAMGEVDLNKCEPWDLPKKAKMGEKEWYFFCQRDRKYPTGMRTNRATGTGYWKATGKDKEVYKGKNCLVGMKKTLVFYKGRAPKGEKSNWVMHEYRLEGKFSYYSHPRTTTKDEWVVCRLFHKSTTGIKKTSIHELLRVNSFGDNDDDDHNFMNFSTLPPLMDPPNNFSTQPGSSNDDHDSDFKEAITSRMSSPDAIFYLSNFSTTNDQNQNPFQPPPSTSYQTVPPNIFNHPQIPTSSDNSSFTFQTSPNIPHLISSGYGGNYQQTTLLSALSGDDETARELEKQCKIEPFSSNLSMLSLSHDTGLSTDKNTTGEISSVVSKQDVGSSKVFEDLDGPSVGAIGDLECLWDY